MANPVTNLFPSNPIEEPVEWGDEQQAELLHSLQGLSDRDIQVYYTLLMYHSTRLSVGMGVPKISAFLRIQ